MQSSPEHIADAPIAVALTPERPLSDLVYPVMTIAAMLWLLASLWAF